jgi:sulfatase maturation enzyme AslB (radical SAM superfamily)
MCTSEWSSQIADEILSNPDLEWQEKPFQKITEITDDAWELLDNWISKIERVFMTGGEPTIIKKNLEYIQKIIDTGRSKQIELIFTTNATNVNKEFLRIAEQFKSVHFAVSIDGVNDLASYIRFPSKWTQIKQNLDTIGQHNFGVSINTTIQWLNMTRLDEMFHFIEQYIESNPKQFAGVWFQLVQTPVYLDPIHAPDFMKHKAISDIDNFLANGKIFKQDKYKSILHGGLEENLVSTRKFLADSLGKQNYVDLFLKNMLQLDKLRKQNLFDVLPELKQLEGL